jgi:NAD(P)-dependent dehydrogenase (short-subunit alcohol dehydrogenase family)
VTCFGRADILYNNAGFSRSGTFEAGSAEDWRVTMRNEVDVVYFPTHAALAYMKASGGGSIINTSSVTAHQANGPFLSIHGIGKGAVASFAPHLAIEGGPYGIRVNTISPDSQDIADHRPHQRQGHRPHPAREGRHAGRHRLRGAIPRLRGRPVHHWCHHVVDGGQSVLMPANT